MSLTCGTNIFVVIKWKDEYGPIPFKTTQQYSKKSVSTENYIYIIMKLQRF
jgi:hypothetical protein